MRPILIVQANGTTRFIEEDETIYPYQLHRPAAEVIFWQVYAIAERHNLGNDRSGVFGCFSTGSWMPAREDALPEFRAVRPSARTGEFIEVHQHYMTEAFLADLASAGLTSTILVQKHDWWLRDKYNQMNEAEQVHTDLGWINAGGWLTEEKIARLRRYGYSV